MCVGGEGGGDKTQLNSKRNSKCLSANGLQVEPFQILPQARRITCRKGAPVSAFQSSLTSKAVAGPLGGIFPIGLSRAFTKQCLNYR